MSKYGIRLIKNKFYPLIASDNLELEEGELVVYQDEIGEDVGKTFIVCSKVLNAGIKKKQKSLFICED